LLSPMALKRVAERYVARSSAVGVTKQSCGRTECESATGATKKNGAGLSRSIKPFPVNLWRSRKAATDAQRVSQGGAVTERRDPASQSGPSFEAAHFGTRGTIPAQCEKARAVVLTVSWYIPPARMNAQLRTIKQQRVRLAESRAAPGRPMWGKHWAI
jgi:hypothetical protein